MKSKVVLAIFVVSSCNAREVLCENVSEDVEVSYSTNSEEAF